MAAKVQKSHGARSELNSVFGLEKADRWNPIRISAIQSGSASLVKGRYFEKETVTAPPRSSDSG
jgi:hypothetical protein